MSDALRKEIAVAVADGLVDAGDGSYVTSFDTHEDAQVVIERVTDRLMDRFFPEDGSPAPMAVQLRECVLRIQALEGAALRERQRVGVVAADQHGLPFALWDDVEVPWNAELYVRSDAP